MGLFSRKKTTIVSSVVYNLAGDINERPDFLKTTVMGATLAGQSMSRVIPESYLNGPGIRTRSFGRWARNSGYSDLVGLTTGTLSLGNSLDGDLLATQIPAPAGQTVAMQSSDIGVADYTYWADQYMLENHPDLMVTDWTIDFDEDANEIVITLEDLTVERFTPMGYDKDGRYLYASYTLTTPEEPGPVVPGVPVFLGSGEAFPSTTGWTEVSYEVTPSTIELTTDIHTVVSYSDGRPNEVSDSTSTTEESFDRIIGVYSRTTYLGSVPGQDKLHSKKETMTQNQDAIAEPETETTSSSETIGGGVIKTTTVTTITEFMVIQRYYQIDTQDIVLKSWSPVKIYIYQRDSGNPILDGMFATRVSAGTFLPFIPMRLDNTFISPSFHPDIYPQAKRALKKAVDSKFDKLIDNIEDNPSLGDIDYAFTVFGVSLNTKEKACSRYVYEFFQEIALGAGGTGSPYLQWRDEWIAAKASFVQWVDWLNGQTDAMNPWFEQPEPPLIPFPPLPQYAVQVMSGNRSDLNFNMRVSWNGMSETTGLGLKKPGAKKGDFWWDVLGTEVFDQSVFTEGNSFAVGSFAVEHVRLNWQVSASSWRSIDVWGLLHQNMVYGGKSVWISGTEALSDPEESGFIIPLHEDIYRAMPLKEATQMATADTYLVFNCYTIVKQKWYQTSLFRIVVVIIVIIISIYSGGAGAAGGSGLLGSNAAVGASVGFSGTAAIVAGAIVNAIAAMIVMQVITSASMALFGDKLGAIIGAIASMVAIYMGTASANGQSMTTSYSALMKADNILRLTIAAGNGYSGYMAAATQDILKQTEDMLNAYAAETKRVQEAYAQNIGPKGGVIDPISLTQATDIQFIESRDSFTSRTLMTGSEVAEMSLDMLTNFAEFTLSTTLQS